jgi:hypothetical protein
MSEIKISNLDKNSIETCKDTISNGGIDLLLVFPENFDDSIANSTSIPNVEIYYNSSSSNSSMAYQTMVAVLDAYESMMANKFDINLGDGVYDLAAEEDFTAMIFSMIMPMLLVMLLFSGCMAVAPESISGEKERGTIASLLVTPAKRSHIAIGKILALSIMALISGASSTLGIVLSLPKLMGDTVTINGSVYGVTDYLMLAVIILSTVLVLITIISIISAYTNLEFSSGEEYDSLDEYDMLCEVGLLNPILALIGEEYATCNNMLNMMMDDVIANNNTVEAMLGYHLGKVSNSLDNLISVFAEKVEEMELDLSQIDIDKFDKLKGLFDLLPKK